MASNTPCNPLAPLAQNMEFPDGLSGDTWSSAKRISKLSTALAGTLATFMPGGVLLAQSASEQVEHSPSALQLPAPIPGQTPGSSALYIYSHNGSTIKIKDGVIAELSVAGKASKDFSQAKVEAQDIVVRDDSGAEVARFPGASRQLGGGAAAIAERDRAMSGAIGGGLGAAAHESARKLNFSSAVRGPRGADRDAPRESPVAAPQPKVMLGISMAVPSAEMAGHFKMKPASGVLVTSVYPQTPAANAGLATYDLITTVNDQPATAERIREVMRKGSPGDAVNLMVIQQGVAKPIRITLAPFDGAKIAGDFTGDSSEVGTEMNNLLKRSWTAKDFGNSVVLPPMPTDPNDQDAWKAFGQQLKDMSNSFKDTWGKDGARPFIMVEPMTPISPFSPPRDLPLVAPVAPNPPNSGVEAPPGGASARLEQLEQRLERIERLLHELSGGRSARPAEQSKTAPSQKLPAESPRAQPGDQMDDEKEKPQPPHQPGDQGSILHGLPRNFVA